jgi:hypothetical protein
MNGLAGLRSLVGAIALFVTGAMPAFSAVIVAPFDITPLFTQVLNDRIGNSRFFFGPNTDRVRVSIFASPSPDSDILGVPSGPDTLFSTNGSATTVTFTHGSLIAPASTTFVGLTSGLGGGRSEYTNSFNRANPVIAPLLDAWDATPFEVTVSNPAAPSGITSVTYSAPDFDRNAMPPFVTDLTLTGGGLTPRLDWTIPATGTTPTSVSIQIRRIDSESPDRSRITAATLIFARSLPAGTTTFTLPPGLSFDQRYEVSVQLDVSSGGALQGRSRTFFEFKPLDTGDGEVSVVLPSVGPDGVFKFDVEVAPGETIALDPEVAIGYEYQIGAGDPLFASVSLPDIGDGLFDLYLFDGTDWIFDRVLAADTQFFFPGAGVDRFRILGIEPSARLHPSDTTAFITSVTFTGAGRFTGTMTPIVATVEIPEPLTIQLLALALLAWALIRRCTMNARPAAVADATRTLRVSAS